MKHHNVRKLEWKPQFDLDEIMPQVSNCTQRRTHERLSKLIDISKFGSIVCLDGGVPKKRVFDRINLPVIAVDGAANYLHDSNIKFEMLMGDFDSVRPDVLEAGRAADWCQVVHLPDQNFVDFRKALMHLKAMNNCYLPCIVFGISGGRMDQILNNINVFCGADVSSDNVFFDNNIIGMKLTTHRKLALEIGTKISLLAAPQARVSTLGLKWDLCDHLLEFADNAIDSCSNRVSATEVEISVHSGTLLVLAYMDDAVDAVCARRDSLIGKP